MSNRYWSALAFVVSGMWRCRSAIVSGVVVAVFTSIASVEGGEGASVISCGDAEVSFEYCHQNVAQTMRIYCRAL